jgi:FMN phosphatase YigB (HAD superfamily)
MRSLIADMDGVIFQHPRLCNMINDRAIEFTKKSINPYMSSIKAKNINETLYKNFGHTVLGIQAVYNPNITIKSFCDYVYDKEFLESMDTVEKDSLFYEHCIDIKEICDSYIKHDKPFYIFSNAPVKWCQNALQMMDIKMEDENIIGCDSPIYGDNIMCLKPMKDSYKKISQYIENKDCIPYKTQFIFVDDQLSNLVPVMENPYWKPIWYNPSQNVFSNKLATITDIQQMRFIF